MYGKAFGLPIFVLEPNFRDAFLGIWNVKINGVFAPIDAFVIQKPCIKVLLTYTSHLISGRRSVFDSEFILYYIHQLGMVMQRVFESFSEPCTPRYIKTLV